MIIVNATEGDNLSAVSLLAERAAPTDPRFRGATLRLAANAAPPDGFTRAGDDVLGPVSLAAGDFDIPFEVVGPGFLGDDSFPGVFRLAGNPAAPQELRFNNVGLVRRMWRTEILSDASGQQFNAAYWGRRRGLHFMTAPLGNVRIAEEPLLMRTAPGFETAKRRDPARADSPDTRLVAGGLRRILPRRRGQRLVRPALAASDHRGGCGAGCSRQESGGGLAAAAAAFWRRWNSGPGSVRQSADSPAPQRRTGHLGPPAARTDGRGKRRRADCAGE